MTTTGTRPETAAPARPVSARARLAVERARDQLLSMQHPAGWWQGELQTNVTIEAEDLLLRQFLGIRTARDTEDTARWIRAQQRADGTWATFAGGPGDLSTTIEAYVALRLAGDPVDARHMTNASTFVRDGGGIEAARVFTRIWLALFGLEPWPALPVMPPELVLLPAWVPLNVYDWACWARQTVVPLTIVNALRPSRSLGLDIAELRTGTPPPAPLPLSTWGGWFQRLDRLLHHYEKRPLQRLRRHSLAKAAHWVIDRQEADGSWGGIQPPWVYSLIALHALGYPLDHPVMQRGLQGLERFTVREAHPSGDVRRLEACQSPVWDTALAMVALGDAGLGPGAEPMHRARDWLLGEEIRCSGDWAIRRPRLEPGGWAFEFDNDGYPDVDDTAEVLLALRRTAGGRELAAAQRRGRRWMTGMQCRDGGWAAFDADNTSRLCAALPFCDFGAVTDPPSADVTAHVIEALAADGSGASSAARRGLRWLLDAQEPDGSWFGRWGANHVYGTGAVLPALVAVGVPTDAPPVRRAVRWLERQQNPDGGWGEDLRSYREPAWIGRGASTASQTAWALLALLAAEERSAAVDRGVLWLADTQREDGDWDETRYTGTGFPGDFYIRYHLYRLVFPLTALARFCDRRT